MVLLSILIHRAGMYVMVNLMNAFALLYFTFMQLEPLNRSMMLHE
jgi:hypothetical protein